MGVEIQGEWCEDPNIVKNEIKDFFRKRMSESDGLDVKLYFLILTLEDNRRLTEPITELEIKELLAVCSKNHSLNGFNFRLIKKF